MFLLCELFWYGFKFGDLLYGGCFVNDKLLRFGV